MNANICLTQGCVVGIVFSDIQPKPFQKILGNFFFKALQSALRMIQCSSDDTQCSSDDTQCSSDDTAFESIS